MWKTVLFLIVTLIGAPIAAYFFDVPFTEIQKKIAWDVSLIYLITAILCFVISSIAKNYSQVDKLWSIMPIIYAWVIAYHADFEKRVILIAVLITLWGARLTFNFARRGGYSLKFWTGEEDYRWAVLRAKPEFNGAWKWILFNFFFISLYQMGLVMLITFPAIKSIGGTELFWADYVLASLVLIAILVEFIADQQQWKYQQKKYELINQQKTLTGIYAKGFTHTGLWAFMRHPNYAMEQLIWILIYVFSVLATGIIVNWTIVGCLLLVLLFKGSSDFSEEISKSKYPEYENYQRSVPRFVPFSKFK